MSNPNVVKISINDQNIIQNSPLPCNGRIKYFRVCHQNCLQISRSNLNTTKPAKLLLVTTVQQFYIKVTHKTGNGSSNKTPEIIFHFSPQKFKQIGSWHKWIQTWKPLYLIISFKRSITYKYPS